MSGMTDIVAAHVVVWGVVQGVGFRYWTERIARERGIVGWVRNVPDGSVAAMIQGSPEAVESMMELLGVGPRLATVDSVDMTPTNPDASLDGFAVRL